MYNPKSNAANLPPRGNGGDFVHSVIHFTAEHCGQKCEICAGSAPAYPYGTPYSDTLRKHSIKAAY